VTAPASRRSRRTLFEILEAQRILAGKARIALLPGGPRSRMLANLLAAPPPRRQQDRQRRERMRLPSRGRIARFRLFFPTIRRHADR
jgi:hypothetical protein